MWNCFVKSILDLCGSRQESDACADVPSAYSLRRCPFCNSHCKYKRERDSHHITCRNPDCGVSVKSATPQQAAARWNGQLRIYQGSEVLDVFGRKRCPFCASSPQWVSSKSQNHQGKQYYRYGCTGEGCGVYLSGTNRLTLHDQWERRSTPP